MQSAPVTSERVFDTVAVVESGGAYLLGLLGRDDKSKGRTGIFGLLFSKGKSGDVIQVWCRTYRIAGPVGEWKPSVAWSKTDGTPSYKPPQPSTALNPNNRQRSSIKFGESSPSSEPSENPDELQNNGNLPLTTLPGVD